MIIYVLTNTHNGKQYVGQTTRSIDQRWTGHLRSATNPLCQTKLACAMRKHGIDAFKREIVQTCLTQAELDLAEDEWIVRLHTLIDGYNICRGGHVGRPAGFKQPEAMKQKMRDMVTVRGSAWYAPMIAAAAKSPHRLGSRNCNAKLTEQLVASLKKEMLTIQGNRRKFPYGQLETLAKKYGVSKATIKAIRSGKLWSQIVVNCENHE